MDSQKILNALHEHYKESIFITDSEGYVVFVNRVAAERLQTTCEELEGKNISELIEDGVYEKSTSLDVIKSKHAVVGQINSDGENITFSNSVPVFDEKGKLEMVVTNNMSVAHNKEWEDIIAGSKIETERLKREIDFMRLQDQRVMIANSPVMKHVISTVDALSNTDSSVVILGESGTGKDMIAMLIHEKSPRRNNAYISINCAAMPENLLESELFGYEGGAFTGALSKGKLGLFEAASGGTLFLDEIGEMSLSLQSKLLRALENHEVRRVGGLNNIPIDVRVICATHENLEKLVEEKKFREDLYYRLSVFTIALPQLAKRREDIIPIAEMFLQELNGKYNKNKVFSDVTIDTMLNYDWPGNIRELRNVVERIFVISKGNELVFTPVPTASYGDEEISKKDCLVTDGFDSLKAFVEYAEIEYIKRVLSDCDGAVGQAADRLGIHRSVLYRKLHKDAK